MLETPQLCVDNQQVTMNILENNTSIQSHGNLRDYTPKLVRSDFCYYLAGLIEGDGSIYVPKISRSVKGKKLYPSIQICFALQDLPLAMVIQQKLKCGSIHRKAHSHAYVLSINNEYGILQIIHLINGILKTPKIDKFHKLIDFVNKRGLSKASLHLNDFSTIEKLPLNKTDIKNNAWFAGFLEADGCFYLRITQKKHKISAGFYLEQRMTDIPSKQSLFSIMEKISFFLKCNVKQLNKTKAEKILHTYRVVTSNEKSNLILIEYLNKYPIFSSKYLNYKDWKKAFKIIQERNGTVKQNIPILLPIKENMNSKRTLYVWDHLQNFYT